MINVSKSDLPDLKEYTEYLEKIWEKGWLTNNGEFVQLLEKRLADYLQVKDLVLVSNGTVAIQIALKALEIKGEVITTPYTFAATTNVILWEGFVPVFADIDLETFNIKPEEAERAITEKTCAIVAVHVYGNPCYVEELQKIADKYHLKLIYDAAHALGVEYQKQSILNYGDLSTLSFHAAKLFQTIEGGAVIANDDRITEKLKLLRNFGIVSEEKIVLPGINAKMNEFQAVMGLCNLKNLDKRIEQRKLIYEYYLEKLSDIENIRFQHVISSRHNYGYFPVCFKDKMVRDKIHSGLLEHDIKARKYFYPLTSDFDYFKKEEQNILTRNELKTAHYISDRILCLPLYADLEIKTADKIVTLIKAIIKE